MLRIFCHLANCLTWDLTITNLPSWGVLTIESCVVVVILALHSKFCPFVSWALHLWSVWLLLGPLYAIYKHHHSGVSLNLALSGDFLTFIIWIYVLDGKNLKKSRYYFAPVAMPHLCTTCEDCRLYRSTSISSYFKILYYMETYTTKWSNHLPRSNQIFFLCFYKLIQDQNKDSRYTLASSQGRR